VLQSDGQLFGSSPVSQVPLPQTEQFIVQSAGHVWQFSVASHVPLPQHWPQSAGQLLHVSVPLHVPSPQPMPLVVEPPVDDDVLLVVLALLDGPPVLEPFVVPLPVPAPLPPFPPSPSSPSTPSSMPEPFAQADARTNTPSNTPTRKEVITAAPRRALYARSSAHRQASASVSIAFDHAQPASPVVQIIHYGSTYAPSDRNRR
jgi:hypothetical protein